MVQVLQSTIFDVDLDRILQSIHVYLQELGMEEIRRRYPTLSNHDLQYFGVFRYFLGNQLVIIISCLTLCESMDNVLLLALATK